MSFGLLRNLTPQVNVRTSTKKAAQPAVLLTLRFRCARKETFCAVQLNGGCCLDIGDWTDKGPVYDCFFVIKRSV